MRLLAVVLKKVGFVINMHEHVKTMCYSCYLIFLLYLPKFFLLKGLYYYTSIGYACFFVSEVSKCETCNQLCCRARFPHLTMSSYLTYTVDVLSTIPKLDCIEMYIDS